MGNLYLLVCAAIFLICLITWLKHFGDPSSHTGAVYSPHVEIESAKIQTNDILKIIIGILSVTCVISILAKYYFHVKFYKLKDYKNFEGINEVFNPVNLGYYRWQAHFFLFLPFLKKQGREELEATRRTINICLVVAAISLLLVIITGMYLKYRISNNLE